MTGSPAKENVNTAAIQETGQEQVSAKVLGVESSKLQKLGLQCISPGLSSDNIDNKMLSTIRMSKTIAREQRQHIEKLGGVGEAATATDHAPRAGGLDSPNAESPPAAGQSLSQTTLAKPRGKSLKRNKVPMPLNIASAGSASQGHRSGLYPLGVESAPAHITNYKQTQLVPPPNRVLKPRVQYVGRTLPRQAFLRRRGLPPGPSASMLMYSCGVNYPPQIANLQYPMLPHMMAVPPSTAYPRLHIPVQTPYMPLSTSTSNARAGSTNTNKIQVDFENFMDGNKQTLVGTRDVFANNTSRWAPLRSQPLSAQEDFFFKRNVHKPAAEHSDNENSSERTDDSGVDNTALENAGEDDEYSTPGNVPRNSCNSAAIAHSELTTAAGTDKIRGEVTIMDDTFAFEFPTIKDKMDKKMFMSICDKVWDESKKLNYNPPQREME